MNVTIGRKIAVLTSLTDIPPHRSPRSSPTLTCMTMKISPFQNFKFNRARRCLLSACASLMVVSLNAADLATWEANGLTNSGPSPFAPTTTATNLTVGGLTRGSGLITGTAGNAWGGTNWFVTGAAAQDAATAIANNRFVYFTVILPGKRGREMDQLNLEIG